MELPLFCAIIHIFYVSKFLHGALNIILTKVNSKLTTLAFTETLKMTPSSNIGWESIVLAPLLTLSFLCIVLPLDVIKYSMMSNCAGSV